jgi:hypothetical protein
LFQVREGGGAPTSMMEHLFGALAVGDHGDLGVKAANSESAVRVIGDLRLRATRSWIAAGAVLALHNRSRLDGTGASQPRYSSNAVESPRSTRDFSPRRSPAGLFLARGRERAGGWRPRVWNATAVDFIGAPNGGHDTYCNINSLCSPDRTLCMTRVLRSSRADTRPRTTHGVTVRPTRRVPPSIVTRNENAPARSDSPFNARARSNASGRTRRRRPCPWPDQASPSTAPRVSFGYTHILNDSGD